MKYYYSFVFTDGASELPLWGSFCVRLAAQPLCMTEDTVSGYLQLQVCKMYARDVVKF